MHFISLSLMLVGLALCNKHQCHPKKIVNETLPVNVTSLRSEVASINNTQVTHVESSPAKAAPVELLPVEADPIESLPANDTCPIGTWQNDSLGVFVYFDEKILKNKTAKEEQSSTCQAESTRCDFEKYGVYHDCIDNKWAEKKCRCPGQICAKGAMFAECRGTVTEA